MTERIYYVGRWNEHRYRVYGSKNCNRPPDTIWEGADYSEALAQMKAANAKIREAEVASRPPTPPRPPHQIVQELDREKLRRWVEAVGISG